MKRKNTKPHHGGKRVKVSSKLKSRIKNFKKVKSVRKTFKRPHLEKIFRPPSSGVSHSTTSLNHKGLKIAKSLKSLMPILRYRDFFTTGINTNVAATGFISGVQTVGNVLNTFVGPDITSLTNIGLKRYSGTTQVGPQLSGQSNTQQSFKILLSHVSTTSSFTNAGSDCVILDIYDCISKKDYTSTTYADPLTDWNQGVIDTTLGGTDYPTGAASGYRYAYNIPFTTPAESVLFMMKWKIVKRTKVELGLGRAHEHVFEYSPNKIVDTELYAANSSASTGNYQNTKGLTHYQFVVARSIFLDTVNSSTSVTGTTSLGPVKVLVGGTRSFSFKLLSDQPTNVAYNSNMFDTTVGSTQYTYNEGSGTQATVTYQ